MNVTRISAPLGSTRIVISRRFAAPRELVFRAYVDPELLVRWWGQDDHVTRIDWHEPRDGGRWRIVSTEADRDRMAGSIEPGVRGSARRLARLLAELTEGTV